MKLDTAFGEFETDQSDADLAAAIADTAKALNGVAEEWRNRDHAPGADGECEECGKAAFTRAIAVVGDDGPFKLDVCAECQDKYVTNEIEAHQRRQAQKGYQEAAERDATDALEQAAAEASYDVADMDGTPTPEDDLDA